MVVLNVTADMKRIFIAIKVYPGEHLMGMLTSFQKELIKESIKWTDPGNIHITLSFLGDTEESLIKAISNDLRQRCFGFAAYDLILSGAGIFKKQGDPKVIWTGIGQSDKLTALNEIVKKGLDEVGVELENRPFRPHLTLGRIRSLKEPGTLEALIDRYKNIELQKVSVNEVILYESILRREGSLYKPVDKFIL